jgi:hypothetical protein
MTAFIFLARRTRHWGQSVRCWKKLLIAINSSEEFLGALSGFIRVSFRPTVLYVFRLGFLSSLSRLRCWAYPLSFPLTIPTVHFEVPKSDAWGSNSTPSRHAAGGTDFAPLSWSSDRPQHSFWKQHTVWHLLGKNWKMKEVNYLS